MTMTDDTIRRAAARPRSDEEEWRYAAQAMAWSGWGSPVGAGVFMVALGAAALLIRLAIVGF